MSLKSLLEEIEAKLESFKSYYEAIQPPPSSDEEEEEPEPTNPKVEKFEGTLTVLSEMSGNLTTQYQEAMQTFFDDIPSGEPGEEINLLRGNSYCAFIGEEMVYPKSREIIWDNMDNYYNGPNIGPKLQEFFDKTSEQMDKFQQEIKKEEDKISKLPTVEKTTDILEEFKEVLLELQTAVASIQALIPEWLTFGNNVVVKASIQLTVDEFPNLEIGDSNQHQVILDNTDAVNTFSSALMPMVDAIPKIQAAKDAYVPEEEERLIQGKSPEGSKAKSDIQITIPPKKKPDIEFANEEIFERLKVKEKSEEFAKNFEEAFSKF